MRLIIFFLFLFNFSFSQFYIINDKDGFVNIRKEENINSKIISKQKNGIIVHSYEDFYENKGNWLGIDFFVNKDDYETGYIYKNRLIDISKYENIPIIKKSSYILLKNKNIEIKITEKKFEKSEHQFKYIKEIKNWVSKIDNQNYYGTDGPIPKYQYDNFYIKINGKKISFPKEAIFNLYEPSLYNTSAHYDKKNDILYIDSWNSDGAGSYEVLWIIEKGKYKKRVIFNGC